MSHWPSSLALPLAAIAQSFGIPFEAKNKYTVAPMPPGKTAGTILMVHHGSAVVLLVHHDDARRVPGVEGLPVLDFDRRVSFSPPSSAALNVAPTTAPPAGHRRREGRWSASAHPLALSV